jgi:hypothetical protein
MPNTSDSFARIGGIVLCSTLLGWKGFVFAVILSAVTSNLYTKRAGVFAAKRKTVVLRARTSVADRVYAVYIHSAEWTDASGNPVRTHVMQVHISSKHNKTADSYVYITCMYSVALSLQTNASTQHPCEELREWIGVRWEGVTSCLERRGYEGIGDAKIGAKARAQADAEAFDERTQLNI